MLNFSLFQNDYCCLPSNLCETRKLPSCVPKNLPVIDSYFRVMYFAGFASFNAIYWVGYYYTTLHGSEEEE